MKLIVEGTIEEVLAHARMMVRAADVGGPTIPVPAPAPAFLTEHGHCGERRSDDTIQASSLWNETCMDSPKYLVTCAHFGNRGRLARRVCERHRGYILGSSQPDIIVTELP